MLRDLQRSSEILRVRSSRVDFFCCKIGEDKAVHGGNWRVATKTFFFLVKTAQMQRRELGRAVVSSITSTKVQFICYAYVVCFFLTDSFDAELCQGAAPASVCRSRTLTTTKVTFLGHLTTGKAVTISDPEKDLLQYMDLLWTYYGRTIPIYTSIFCHFLIRPFHPNSACLSQLMTSYSIL